LPARLLDCGLVAGEGGIRLARQLAARLRVPSMRSVRWSRTASSGFKTS